MRGVGAPSRWSLVGEDGPGGGRGREGRPEEEAGLTTATVGMSGVGSRAAGRSARGGSEVPSAECDREDETGRSAGLVPVWISGERKQRRRIREEAEKTQAVARKGKAQVWRGS